MICELLNGFIWDELISFPLLFSLYFSPPLQGHCYTFKETMYSSLAYVKYFQEKLCADMNDLIFTVEVIVVTECFSTFYLWL
jgi:hypothetical protein